MKIWLKYLISILLLILISLGIFELIFILSFQCHTCWDKFGNRLVAQKVIRSERNVIQFMDECADYDNQLSYVLKEGKCNFNNREFDTVLTINKEGNRNIDIGSKSCKIAFLGDSFTMGWGVNDSKNFPYLVSKSLNCQAHNMGVSSYGTAREVLALNNSSVDKIDTIFLQYSDNDLKENKSFYDNRNKLKIMSPEDYANIKDAYLSRKDYYPLKYSFVLFAGIYNNLAKRLSRTKMPDIDDGVKEVDYFYNALKKIDNRFNTSNLIIYEINGTNRNDSFFMNSLEEKYMHELEKKFNKVKFVDLSIYLNEKHYFIFDDHINDHGHNLVSEVLIKSLGD